MCHVTIASVFLSSVLCSQTKCRLEPWSAAWSVEKEVGIDGKRKGQMTQGFCEDSAARTTGILERGVSKITNAVSQAHTLHGLKSGILK